MEIPAEAFDEILKELSRQPLELNKYRKKVGDGRSQAFGVVGRRCLPVDYSRQCWRRAYLYKLLLDFGTKYVNIPWNAITVNQNYQAKPHYDRHNVGDSFLVAFGEYTGGELVIHEGPKAGTWDIRHRAIQDNFSKCLHEVKPFSGTRVSLVYYNYSVPEGISLPPPSVRQHENKRWVFYRGEEAITTGLPHPLAGRKKGAEGGYHVEEKTTTIEFS